MQVVPGGHCSRPPQSPPLLAPRHSSLSMPWERKTTLRVRPPKTITRVLDPNSDASPTLLSCDSTESNSAYQDTGAVADLYQGATLSAHHYFNAQGLPTFATFDTATGAQTGIVSGRPLATAAAPRQADDGGFGSVAELLLGAVNAEGDVSVQSRAL